MSQPSRPAKHMVFCHEFRGWREQGNKTLKKGRIFLLVLFKRRVPDQVRTLNMQGVPTIPRQMGLKVGKIRQRLSLATVKASQGVLPARLGQVGEGSAMAGGGEGAGRGWRRGE